MKVFYHVDNDGKCAGFWIKRLAKHTDRYPIEFYKINYGMDFPFEDIQPKEQVFIVDYSIEPEEMDRLLGITKNVTWIDHHASAIAKYKNYNKNISGIRYDGVAGCMLTYCYLKYMTDGGVGDELSFETGMTDGAPMFTKLIADYDVWKFEYGNKSKAFKYGLELYSNEPEDSIWNCIYNTKDVRDYNYNFTNLIIQKGESVATYRKNFTKEYCKHYGFETSFNCYKCFAINLGMINSDDFQSIDVGKYDMLIGFSFDGDKWSYSLRSSKIDCSKVAIKYGGGGHKDAAGFSCEDLLLKKIDNLD